MKQNLACTLAVFAVLWVLISSLGVAAVKALYVSNHNGVTCPLLVLADANTGAFTIEPITVTILPGGYLADGAGMELDYWIDGASAQIANNYWPKPSDNAYNQIAKAGVYDVPIGPFDHTKPFNGALMPGETAGTLNVNIRYTDHDGDLRVFTQNVRIVRALHPFVVGGIEVPVDKSALLAPYIGLASTTMIGAVATAVYVKRAERRKEKQ